MKLFGLVLAPFFAVLTIVFSPPAFAENSNADPVILTVTVFSKADVTPVKHDYRMQDLEALGTTNVTTQTPWFDTEQVFDGVPLRALMEDLAVKSGTAKASALNDYTVDIPVSDFMDYNVILATKRDGQYLSVRDRGPLWIIYPWSNDKTLRNTVYYSRAVWQLNTLDVFQK